MKIYDKIINTLNEGVTNAEFQSELSRVLDVKPEDIIVKRYAQDGAWLIVKGYTRKLQAVGSNIYVGVLGFNMDSDKQMDALKAEMESYKEDPNTEQLSLDLEAEMVPREAGEIDEKRRADLVARLKKYWPRVPKAWIDNRTDDYIEQVVKSYEEREKKKSLPKEDVKKTIENRNKELFRARLADALKKRES